MSIGYLGPEGTFTQQAASLFSENDKLVPYVTILDAMLAVENGKIEKCVVPIENSTEGLVNSTIDALLFDTNLYIQDLISFQIIQNLMVNKKNTLFKVDKILSHPQGIAQCRRFLNENYNGAELVEVSSTGKASKIVSESDENIGSIGNDLCSEIYNLNIVKRDIQDNKKNKTSFILLSKNDTSTPKLKNKTSLAFSTYDKPGELYKILDIFALWDINMSKISSRPMRDGDGEYIFYVDIEDFKDVQDVRDAFIMIRRKTNFFKILGTYGKS